MGNTTAQRKTKIKSEFEKLELRMIPSKSQEDVSINISPFVKWLCWFVTGAAVGGAVGSATVEVSSTASTFGEVFVLDVPSFFFAISNLSFPKYRQFLVEKFN